MMTISIDAGKDSGHAIFFRFGKIAASDIKKGEKPPTTQLSETDSVTEPASPTIEQGLFEEQGLVEYCRRESIYLSSSDVMSSSGLE